MAGTDFNPDEVFAFGINVRLPIAAAYHALKTNAEEEQFARTLLRYNAGRLTQEPFFETTLAGFSK